MTLEAQECLLKVSLHCIISCLPALVQDRSFLVVHVQCFSSIQLVLREIIAIYIQGNKQCDWKVHVETGWDSELWCEAFP